MTVNHHHLVRTRTRKRDVTLNIYSKWIFESPKEQRRSFLLGRKDFFLTKIKRGIEPDVWRGTDFIIYLGARDSVHLESSVSDRKEREGSRLVIAEYSTISEYSSHPGVSLDT